MIKSLKSNDIYISYSCFYYIEWDDIGGYNLRRDKNFFYEEGDYSPIEVDFFESIKDKKVQEIIIEIFKD